MRRILPFLALFALPLLAQAEARPTVKSGTMAFVAGVSPSPSVGGAWFISPTGSIRADLGFTLSFKPTGAALTLDAGYRHHFSPGALRPFIQPGISFGYNDLINFAVGSGFGLEYFITPRVSLAAMAVAALRFDNGGNSVSLNLNSSGLSVSFFL